MPLGCEGLKPKCSTGLWVLQSTTHQVMAGGWSNQKERLVQIGNLDEGAHVHKVHH